MDKFVHSYNRTQGLKAVGATVALTAASQWLGYTIEKISFISQPGLIHALGFGLVAKGVAIVATPLFSHVFKNQKINDVFANAFGGLVAYGASYGLAALGYVAAPISVPVAVTLTIVSIAVALLLGPTDHNHVYGTVKWGTDTYTGQLKQGKPEGEGRVKSKEGKVIFEGQVKDWKKVKGTWTSDSICYKGSFDNDHFIEGETIQEFKDTDGSTKTCKCTWKNGKVWDGTFRYKHKETTNDRSGTFVGEYKAGKLEKGTFTYNTGYVYQGSFNNFLPEGEGTVTFPDKETYTGSFIHGVGRHGKGKQTDTNPEFYYDGEWKKDRQDGNGIEKYKNGSVYEGSWKEGRKHGRGKHTTKEGNVFFEGEYREDKEFTGEYSGRKYEGPIVAGEMHGKGKFTTDDGTIYEGSWVNDKKEGEFNVAVPGKTQVRQTFRGDVLFGEFTGEVKDGMRVRGTLKFTNGQVYTGMYVNDRRKDDHAEYTWSDGTRYVGGIDEVTVNRFNAKEVGRNGKGKQEYANHDVYEGEWQKDKRSGNGTQTYADGLIYEGEWVLDERQGKGKLTKAGKVLFEGEFRNNDPYKGAATDLELGDGSYEGQLEFGKKEGYGKLKLKEGAIYEGLFSLDSKKGTFIVTIPGQAPVMQTFVYNILQGTFVGDIKDGIRVKGTFTYTYGDTQTGSFEKDYLKDENAILTWPTGERYEGGYNRRRFGRGKQTFIDGSVYEGFWLNDKRHHNGTQTFASGLVYEGRWEEDKMHGQGKYTKDGNVIFEGKFENDQPYTGKAANLKWNGGLFEGTVDEGRLHGKGKFTTADGTIYEGVWRLGKKQGEFTVTLPGEDPKTQTFENDALKV